MFIVYNIPIKLIDFNNLQKKEIIAKYSQNKKKIKYSDIYAFLLSKNE